MDDNFLKKNFPSIFR